MSATNFTLRLLLLAFCAGAGVCSTGCANSGRPRDPCRKDYYYGPPGCFGHYSTCWREWPEECVACPPFTQGIWQAQAAEQERAKLPEEVAKPGGTAEPAGPLTPDDSAEPRGAAQPEGAAADEASPRQSLPPIIEKNPRKAPLGDDPSSYKIRKPPRDSSSRRTQVLPAKRSAVTEDSSSLSNSAWPR